MHIELSDEQFKALIFLLIGLAFLIYGWYFNNRVKKLHQTGKKARGVIFELIYSASGSGSSKSITYYPVIRFLTDKDEWITRKYEVGREQGIYREGDEVMVYYDPATPEDFILDDRTTNWLGSIFVALGTLMSAGATVFMILKR